MLVISVPIGLLAMVVVQPALHLRLERQNHAIDWTGASLLVAGTSALRRRRPDSLVESRDTLVEVGGLRRQVIQQRVQQRALLGGRRHASKPSSLASTWSITSSAPPPIDSRRLSRKNRDVQVSSM